LLAIETTVIAGDFFKMFLSGSCCDIGLKHADTAIVSKAFIDLHDHKYEVGKTSKWLAIFPLRRQGFIAIQSITRLATNCFVWQPNQQPQFHTLGRAWFVQRDVYSILVVIAARLLMLERKVNSTIKPTARRN
jgi:hypothetical protein